MPWDHQGRTWLDPIAPRPREAVWRDVLAGLAQPRMWAHWRGLGAHRLGALAGTHDFASPPLPGHPGLTRQRGPGHTRSDHAARTPGSVGPGPSQGLAWPPESLRPPEGQGKQDGERAAGTRWRRPHAAQVAAQ